MAAPALRAGVGRDGGRGAGVRVFADRASALGWRNATLAYHRGMILRGLGRDGDARAALAEALTSIRTSRRCTPSAPEPPWPSCPDLRDAIPNKDIAGQLFLSPKTVEYHLAR